MGKIIYAEENIISYLKNLSTSNICSTGLILGQSTNSKDYVALLVRTPLHSQSEKQMSSTPTTFHSLKEINESWIIDHAKHVTKMLPGGMWVLGAFICSPTNIFFDSLEAAKAKSILSLLKKHLSKEPLLNANSPTTEKLLFHFNTTDSFYSCKTYDCNIMSDFKSADWKLQSMGINWCKINCNCDLSHPAIAGNILGPLKEQLKAYLKEINAHLEKAMLVINGQINCFENTLEEVIKTGTFDSKNYCNKIPSLWADILIPCKRNQNKKSITLKDHNMELKFLGVVTSQVFISQNATVAEAINAIKQDIIRSLTVRFEMHWDSLVEEENGFPEENLTVHEPPRRVSILLPNGIIALNDYLFPGEGFSEVVSSFKEMLDIEINEKSVEKESEIQGDSMEFFHNSHLMSAITDKSNEVLEHPLPKGLIFLFSIVVLLIGVAIALIIQNGKEDELSFN